MSRELKIGDRVHTTRWNRRKRYHTGDKGTVLQTLKMHDGGLPFCLVAMDKDVSPTAGVLFDTGEIDADLEGRPTSRNSADGHHLLDDKDRPMPSAVDVLNATR